MPLNKRKTEDILKHSFARCMASGLERRSTLDTSSLKHFAIDEQSLFLKNCSQEAFLFIQEMVDSDEWGLVLSDANSMIIDIQGNIHITKYLSKFGITPLACLSEEIAGSNAINIAIFEDTPIFTLANQHFLFHFEGLFSVAAPIHNNENEIVGTLSIWGKSENAPTNGLQLAQKGADFISKSYKWQADKEKNEKNLALLNSIFDTLNNGLIAVNSGGTVVKLNQSVSRMLGLRNGELNGTFIGKILPLWHAVNSRLQNGERIFDEELVFENVPLKEKYAVNLLPRLMEGRFVGAVIIIREMKRVYNMVNKFTGMSARYTFDDIIGESYEMQRVIEYAKIVANSPSTILIDGESGTGKELLAQSIHSYSHRGSAGFIAVNCGALPESLIESELFGYDDGAFTGARKGGKPGKFELANGGTLFLDEIGEMPIDMQVKLLRVIQEGVITRVGGTKEIRVDVRIIAATNKDLKEEIKKGLFRLDLYYRLSVIPLRIPSLKERKEDIPMLINYFLHSKALKLNKDVPEISPEVYHFLLTYPWPGNVRELENFIEKTVNLNGNIVWDVSKEQVKNLPNVGSAISKKTSTKSELMTFDEMEKRLITEALKELNGNISQIAKVLGTSRNTLYLKMRKYRIEH